MFGSQVLETAIGLALLFFVVSVTASAVVEVLSRLMGLRSKGLLRGMVALVAGTDPTKQTRDELEKSLGPFAKTSVYQAVKLAAGRRAGSAVGRIGERGPAYLSAKAFADAASELVKFKDGKIEWPEEMPEQLKKRLSKLFEEVSGNVTEVKAGLERWFDEGMRTVEAAYKRWVTIVLFFVGLGLAAMSNISAIHVAQELWRDSVTRAAVADAASGLASRAPAAAVPVNTDNPTEDSGNTTDDGGDTTRGNPEASLLSEVAAEADEIVQLHLPIGYGCPSGEECFSWRDPDLTLWPLTFAGWLLTALLAMLGAPFWFDAMSRLVSLRTAGTKPEPASNDEGSAVTSVKQAAGSPTLVFRELTDGTFVSPPGPRKDL